MATSPNGATFSELAGSPTMRISTEGISGMRKFWVPNSPDLIPFLQEVIGQWVLVGPTGQSQQCFFQAPMPFPGYSNVVPDDIQVVPHLASSPEGTFPVDLSTTYNDYKGGWDVTVQYKTVYNLSQQLSGMPTVPNGTYLSYEADLSAEYLTIPGRTWRWMISPGNPLFPLSKNKLDDDTSPGVLTPTGNYTLTWDRVLEPPLDAIRAARGHVNCADFFGSPAGTVLFLGAQIRRQFQFTNDGGFWQVQYKFAENIKTLNSGTQVGWNYFYSPTKLNGENWLLIGTSDGAYEPPYPCTDFTSLFAFPGGIIC